ncbi:MAG: rhomboid family intramembrane serine protease, partial [Gammaproteobacteria bacterium]
MTGRQPYRSRYDSARLRRSAGLSVLFVGLLWWIRLLESLFGWDFTGLGVYPLHVAGLIGVLTAPLVHASFQHLFSNTLPLLILGTFLLYVYPRSARFAVPAIWLGSGLGVWLTARPAYHIGASGLATGLMCYLFLLGMLRRDRRAVAFGMLTFFLYGGMLWGIFPHEPDVSYESHFWGAVMGLAMAVLLFRYDPPPAERRYRWEEETEDVDDPLIGDLWKQARGPERPA